MLDKVLHTLRYKFSRAEDFKHVLKKQLAVAPSVPTFSIYHSNMERMNNKGCTMVLPQSFP